MHSLRVIGVPRGAAGALTLTWVGAAAFRSRITAAPFDLVVGHGKTRGHLVGRRALVLHGMVDGGGTRRSVVLVLCASAYGPQLLRGDDGVGSD